jgi:CRISPR/Cas system-associated exonuclease Cas4 (RecB family)
LFNPNDKERRKAILQLFLYCYAYLVENKDCKQVQPVIYKISSMKESGVICTRKKSDGGDYEYVFSMDDRVAQDFITGMATTIRNLYESDFAQAAEGAKACDYCRFIDFCRRTPVKR